jgi:hypothetical protein
MFDDTTTMIRLLVGCVLGGCFAVTLILGATLF